MGTKPRSGRPEKLTPKQEAFVREYLVDLNATQAAKRAGYRGNDVTLGAVGAENLKKPQIARVVAEAQAKLSAKVEVTQEYVLSNLKEILERCMQRAPVMVREGREMVQAKDEEGRHVWAFNAKGAVMAVTKLGEHRGMFKTVHQHENPDGSPIFDHVRELILAQRASGSRGPQLDPGRDGSVHQQGKVEAPAAPAPPGSSPR